MYIPTEYFQFITSCSLKISWLFLQYNYIFNIFKVVSAQDSFRRLYIKSSSACCGSQTSITFYTSLMGVRTVFQNILVSRRVQVCSRYSFKTTIGLIRRHLEQKPGPSPVWFHYWSLPFARRMFLAVLCLSVAAVSAQAPVPCSKYM